MWERTDRRIERVQRTVDSRHQAAVILEDIHDPYNAQAVFRTCDAMGIQHVHIVFEQERPFDPRDMGKPSSSSAHKWLNFTIHNSSADCITDLKAEGYEVVATVLEPDSESLFEIDLTAPRVALLLGNEHRGLSSHAVELADRKLMIPMRGMVQSLNLSVTAALCLYELTRQRELKGMENYALGEDDRRKLADDLLRR